jgi:hypothetical protein
MNKFTKAQAFKRYADAIAAATDIKEARLVLARAQLCNGIDYEAGNKLRDLMAEKIRELGMFTIAQAGARLGISARKFRTLVKAFDIPADGYNHHVSLYDLHTVKKLGSLAKAYFSTRLFLLRGEAMERIIEKQQNKRRKSWSIKKGIN